VEVAFEKPVTFGLNFNGTIAPVGFTGAVKKLDILGNARVERVVDRITSDSDMIATDACDQKRGLYRGFPPRARGFPYPDTSLCGLYL
jgi:hypothetical protein